MVLRIIRDDNTLYLMKSADAAARNQGADPTAGRALALWREVHRRIIGARTNLGRQPDCWCCKKPLPDVQHPVH